MEKSKEQLSKERLRVGPPVEGYGGCPACGKNGVNPECQPQHCVCCRWHRDYDVFKDGEWGRLPGCDCFDDNGGLKSVPIPGE